MSSKLQPFSYDNLRHALGTILRQSANLANVNHSVDAIKKKLNDSTNPTRRELIRAIFATKLFENTSTIPQQIADSFDLMIRRDVPSFTRAKLKEKLNETQIQQDLYNYVIKNLRLKKILGEDPNQVIAILNAYINIVFRTRDLESETLIKNFFCDTDDLYDKVRALEEELKIFSGVINEEHRDFIKNLFKLFLVGFLKIWETKSLQPLSSVQNSSDIEQKPYLDLCSGALNIKYLDQLLSADHSRQFLFLDKSQAITVFYDTVDELTEGEFGKRVRLVNQDICSDWTNSIQAGSVGTIRASNIFSFIVKNPTLDECKQKIRQLFLNINKALAPGGKFIMCLRHNPESTSQDISIDEILEPTRDYGLKMHEGYDPLKQEISIFHYLLLLLEKLATEACYTFKVGHTDSSGNFIECKTASTKDILNAETELIMIKPKR
jgi:hypothetical protein